MSPDILERPTRLRRRAGVVVKALARLVALEVPVRRRTLPELCASSRIAFSGFERPEPVVELRPLPRHVAQIWWGVETALRWWPFARRRRCLRRSLVLGRQISHLEPVLTLELVRPSPLLVHAVLVVRGHRLDLGTMDGDRAPVRQART